MSIAGIKLGQFGSSDAAKMRVIKPGAMSWETQCDRQTLSKSVP